MTFKTGCYVVLGYPTLIDTFHSATAMPNTTVMTWTIQPVLSFRSTASAVLDAEVSVRMLELELSRLPEVFVGILFASKFVATVTVAAAFVTVAVIAVPLEDSVMIVSPAVPEAISMYVAVGFEPTVVDSPGVRRRVAPPTVIDATGGPVGRTPGAAVMLGFAVPCCIGCELSPG
jgi:hypothetical protein